MLLYRSGDVMRDDPTRTCPECGAGLPPGWSVGKCPYCLLGLGLAAARAHGAGQRSEVSGQTSGVVGPVAGGEIATSQSLIVPQFDDYELLEEIGRGGMGVVYRARQKSLARLVALKLLLFGPHAPPESVKRFRAEAVATAALQHPNIVAIHEVGCHAGQHFLVMDLVEGPSLAREIAGFRLPTSGPRRAAGYVKTIAEAIHYAHERGILHRDLKPSNVLIDANDQPRVTDFGLAKHLEGDSELTVSGQVLGSPNYMPPEQAAGRRGRVSRRSDVYALGAILYHAVTGRPPFVGEGVADTVQQVLNVEPVPPRTLNPRLPVDLETICLKCLEKEPARRYATAQLLAEELGRFISGQPVLARPIGLPGKAWRWCRRNPRVALASCAAILSLLTGLAGTTWQWRRAAAERTRAEAGGWVARRNAYAADMLEARRALEESNLGRARRLLEAHRPAGKSEVDLRGWEWRYLWSRCQGEERFTLCQYSNAVTALAFSPDGKWLAVRRDDGAVAVWDTVSRRSVSEMPGAGYYRALAFSPQGNLLAWGNQDAGGKPVITLWDPNARKQTGCIPLSEVPVSLSFSPDGRILATAGSDGTNTLWEVTSQSVLTNFTTARANFWAELFPAATEGKPSATADPTVTTRGADSPPRPRRRSQFDLLSWDHFGSVLFSRDGKWLAVGEDLPRIWLLDRITGEVTVIPVPAAGGINALAFSPDSRRLAASCGFEDHHLFVWDLPKPGPATRFAGHRGCIAGLAFSPKGHTLASVSVDRTLRLWDVARQVERPPLQGHTDEVWAVAWSPDGHDLVTGGKDGSVRFWDPAKNPAPTHAILNERAWLWGPAFSPDSKSLLTVTRPRGAVVRWNAGVEANVWRRAGELSWLGTNHTCVGLSGDGRWLVVGDLNGNLQVWDYPNRQMITNLVLPGRRIFLLVFSASGKTLHCGTALHSDGRLGPKLYSVDGWLEIKLRGLKLDDAQDWDLSPDEETVAWADQDGTVSWWNFVTGEQQTLFRYRNAGRVQVAFSRDGRAFAAGTRGGEIQVWDVATRRVRLTAYGSRSVLTDLASSPDGRRLVAAGIDPDALITLWDVETGREVATLPGEPGLVVHSGFSPDGQTLFATTFEGITLLWHAPSQEETDAAGKPQEAQ